MRSLKWMMSVLAVLVAFSLGSTAMAQDAPTDDTEQTEETTDETTGEDETETADAATDEEQPETDEDGFVTNQGAESSSPTGKAPAEFGLNMDLMLAAGFGSLLYPHIEPSLDIGVAPLGPVTFSVGGSVDVGYCLLCGVVTALSNWKVNSWYWSLQGRALIHFNQLSRMAQDNFNIDLYAGVSLGPQFYNFTLGYKPTDDEASVDIVTFLGGPVFGARIFGDDIGFFGYAELRYFIEAGFGETTIEIDNQEFTLTNDYRRGGSDITLGFGYRF
ncbi:MAG: hypothetical protein ACQEVA_14750 [Myxococcota bacterium]